MDKWSLIKLSENIEEYFLKTLKENKVDETFLNTLEQYWVRKTNKDSIWLIKAKIAELKRMIKK